MNSLSTSKRSGPIVLHSQHRTCVRAAILVSTLRIARIEPL